MLNYLVPLIIIFWIIKFLNYLRLERSKLLLTSTFDRRIVALLILMAVSLRLLLCCYDPYRIHSITLSKRYIQGSNVYLHCNWETIRLAIGTETLTMSDSHIQIWTFIPLIKNRIPAFFITKCLIFCNTTVFYILL